MLLTLAAAAVQRAAAQFERVRTILRSARANSTALGVQATIRSKDNVGA